MHVNQIRLAASVLSIGVLTSAAFCDEPATTIAAWGLSDFNQMRLTGAVDIAAGGGHSMAIRADGSLVCWGYSDSYICSDPALLKNVRSVSANTITTVIAHDDGSVSYIGYISPSLKLPTDLVNVDRVRIGNAHGIAILKDGSLRAWGSNSSGQTAIPSDLGTVRDVAAGHSHCVAIRQDASVAAWGANSYGQSTVPSSLGPVRSVVAGMSHSAALRDDGSVIAWGSNADKQCTVPADLGSVTQLASHSSAKENIALRFDGTIAWWGTPGSYAQHLPAGLRPATKIAMGESHALALHADGTITAWGWSGNGQCATGSTRIPDKMVARGSVGFSVFADGSLEHWGNAASSFSSGTAAPAIPADIGLVDSIAIGSLHFVAVRKNGSVRCWGDNYRGQCTPPVGLTGVVEAAAGGNHSLARRADGTIAQWGTFLANPPATLSTATAIAAGKGFSLANQPGGTVVGWGEYFSTAAQVPATATNVIGMAAGLEHALALRQDGTVVAWGRNDSGQAAVPAGLAGVTQVAAGDAHSLALRADGTVAAWGSNCGPLGCGTNQSIVPAWVRGVRMVLGAGVQTIVVMDRNDCDNDDRDDAWQIETGELDLNMNWQLDDCERTWGDMDVTGELDNADLSLLLLDFGPCLGCPTDLDGNGTVDFSDVALLVLSFGPVG